MEPSCGRVAVAVATSHVFIGVLLVSFLSGFCNGSSFSMEVGNSLSSQGSNNGDHLLSATHRKLLIQDETVVRPNRNPGERCSKGDILIHQGPTAPLPSGIPTYTVEIINMCFTGCNISRIHLRCGWFSSAHPISPKVFKRIAYDDCLVNQGKPLVSGGVVGFKYATTRQYPLSVSSFFC